MLAAVTLAFICERGDQWLQLQRSFGLQQRRSVVEIAGPVSAPNRPARKPNTWWKQPTRWGFIRTHAHTSTIRQYNKIVLAYRGGGEASPSPPRTLGGALRAPPRLLPSGRSLTTEVTSLALLRALRALRKARYVTSWGLKIIRAT